MRFRCAAFRLAALLAAVCAPAAARADTRIVEPLIAGRCSVVVTIDPSPAPAGFTVQIDLNKKTFPAVVVSGQQQIAIRLRGPLEEGDVVRLRTSKGMGAADAWGTGVTVAGSTDKPECQPNQKANDTREPLYVSGYGGLAFENFAPASIGGYANDASGGPHKRYVVGLDFDARVLGGPDSPMQLWVFGETLNGVRSADVNCKDEKERPPVCGSLQQLTSSDAQLWTLEHASSLEAFIGARLELKTIQADTGFASAWYVGGQVGIMMLSGTIEVPSTSVTNPKAPVADGSVDITHGYRADHVGTGLLIKEGSYEGSYLELGWGKTELFTAVNDKSKWNRIKFDAHLSFPIGVPFTEKILHSGPRAFVQVFGDFDWAGKGSDALQTFVGLDVDVKDLFKWK